MRALIIAGGAGSRLRPLTDTVPKPLVEFMGEPFAFGQMRRLAAAGVRQVSFLVGPYREDFAILVALGRELGVAVDFEDEETPLGTAGAARRALRRHTGGPVLVCNGDILTDLDYAGVVAAHRQAQAAATLALTRVEDPSAYGVVICDADGRVTQFIEKPAPGTVTATTVNAGTYVLEPTVFDEFRGDGPLSFERQVFPGLLDTGAPMHGVVSDAHWADLGTPERYLAGHLAVLDGACAWPMAAGLDERAPEVWVAADAQVSPSAVLASGVVIGAGAEVGAGARVARSAVHAGARIGAQSQVSDTIVGPDAVVSSDAQLRDEVVVSGPPTVNRQ